MIKNALRTLAMALSLSLTVTVAHAKMTPEQIKDGIASAIKKGNMPGKLASAIKEGEFTAELLKDAVAASITDGSFSVKKLEGFMKRVGSEAVSSRQFTEFAERVQEAVDAGVADLDLTKDVSPKVAAMLKKISEAVQARIAGGGPAKGPSKAAGAGSRQPELIYPLGDGLPPAPVSP